MRKEKDVTVPQIFLRRDVGLKACHIPQKMFMLDQSSVTTSSHAR